MIGWGRERVVRGKNEVGAGVFLMEMRGILVAEATSPL